ncbi:MAG: hypothetical protein KKC30_18710 [Proteobacteria bacterium]|nr:hypothetical protein [Pseudomonadota bacterium]MBU4385005.1 hypothetical protein [Pseudomonadota bacterium]MCG2763129.1 hypothetical protein [Desulfarculaceae bacterium]
MSPIPLHGWPYPGTQSPAELLRRAGVDLSTPSALAASLPFSLGDATCGCENELQAAVLGPAEAVDLPRSIVESNYYRNMAKRERSGEMPRRVINELEQWLQANPRGLWENSWVRLDPELLSPLARQAWECDLLADKEMPHGPRRVDAGRFSCADGRLRLPVSYLLKLSLLDALGRRSPLPPELRARGRAMAEHYLSDNTSPETYSFHLSRPDGPGAGRQAADETCRRYLLTHLLALHAETSLGLAAGGQKVAVYFSPHPPVRQKQLSECISDSFYRELFMNPCLSGWAKGEQKHQYMHLCHQVLSRAQFNGLFRLKEAGIILNNLVTLPSASNISLANNGTHVSLGSKKLSQAMGASGLEPAHEKYLGDLVTKFVEHFLPLFVGTYSAAPYRLAFGDFHPEKVLSFLPFELDYTHLRMIWRRWRKKAHLKVRPLGLRLTPFGPPWLDEPLAKLFGLRGDCLPDFRLMDYLVCLMSTGQSPALDGRLGNHERLKQDLAAMGVFDPSMPLYMLHRQREMATHGFAGFEGRHYSLFYSLRRDLAGAVDMQRLLTVLAFALIAKGRLSHSHIPDHPEVESERRQIFFAAAIGLPTFFVRQDTPNLLMKSILERTAETRPSRRYPGYQRVKVRQYFQACLNMVEQEGAEIIDCLGLGETLADLRERLAQPGQRSALGRLTHGILSELGASDPLRADARQFNQAAEDYYRTGLRRRHLGEAWQVLSEDLTGAGLSALENHPTARRALGRVLAGREPQALLAELKEPVLDGRAGAEDVSLLINLLLTVIDFQVRPDQADLAEGPPMEQSNEFDHPSVHRQA